MDSIGYNKQQIDAKETIPAEAETPIKKRGGKNNQRFSRSARRISEEMKEKRSCFGKMKITSCSDKGLHCMS